MTARALRVDQKQLTQGTTMITQVMIITTTMIITTRIERDELEAKNERGRPNGPPSLVLGARFSGEPHQRHGADRRGRAYG